MPNTGLLAGQNSPPIQTPDLFPFSGLVQRFLPMNRIRELYQRERSASTASDKATIRKQIEGEGLSRVTITRLSEGVKTRAAACLRLLQ